MYEGERKTYGVMYCLPIYYLRKKLLLPAPNDYYLHPI